MAKPRPMVVRMELPSPNLKVLGLPRALFGFECRNPSAVTGISPFFSLSFITWLGERPSIGISGSSPNRLDPACIYLGRDGGLIFAAPFLGWKPAEPVMEVNDDFVAEGCPIESRDGLSPFLVTLHDDPRREPALVH